MPAVRHSKIVGLCRSRSKVALMTQKWDFRYTPRTGFPQSRDRPDKTLDHLCPISFGDWLQTDVDQTPRDRWRASPYSETLTRCTSPLSSRNVTSKQSAPSEQSVVWRDCLLCCNPRD